MSSHLAQSFVVERSSLSRWNCQISAARAPLQQSKARWANSRESRRHPSCTWSTLRQCKDTSAQKPLDAAHGVIKCPKLSSWICFTPSDAYVRRAASPAPIDCNASTKARVTLAFPSSLAWALYSILQASTLFPASCNVHANMQAASDDADVSSPLMIDRH